MATEVQFQYHVDIEGAPGVWINGEVTIIAEVGATGVNQIAYGLFTPGHNEGSPEEPIISAWVLRTIEERRREAIEEKAIEVARLERMEG